MDFNNWLENLGLAYLSAPIKSDISASKYDTDVQGRPTPAAIAANVEYSQNLSIAVINDSNGNITLVYPIRMPIKKAKADAKKYGSQQFLDQFKNSYDLDEIYEKIKILKVFKDPQGLKISIEIPSQKEFETAKQKYPSSVEMKT